VAAAGGSVLIVEDDPAIRFLCRVNLELEGFSVSEATTLDEAREAVSVSPPCVVFLDVHLGGDSCDPLLDELRAGSVPVVLVTGIADPGRYSMRAAEMLPKPFEPAALVAAARRYVE
jgi:DNA-binding response OmpR family regulator